MRTKALWLVASVLIFGLLHMTNVFSGMDVASAFNQSVKAMAMGLVAGLIYLRTRALLPLVLWHASVDFTLFANLEQPYFFGGVWGFLIDATMAILTLFVLWDLTRELLKSRSRTRHRTELTRLRQRKKTPPHPFTGIGRGLRLALLSAYSPPASFSRRAASCSSEARVPASEAGASEEEAASEPDSEE
ncbi:hypothetical protein COFA105466_10725 [Corynebacterium falsenii]